MKDHEVSAFSVYSSNKKPKILNLKKKAKQKSKKKKKLQENNVTSIMKTLIKVAESSASNTTPEKPSKKNDKKKLLKALMDENESLFKNCIVTTKVDNLFLRENNSAECSTDEKMESNVGFMKKTEKSQKKKKKSKKSTFEGSEETNKNNVIDKNWEMKINFSSVNNKNEIPQKPKEKDEVKKISNKNPEPLNVIHSDSVKLGEELFSWLLSPYSAKKFFKHCWEQKPLHVKHNNENYFKCICTFEDFEAALRDHDMYFTKNIDITSYINGERATENPEGKAKPSVVWDFYKKGRSIRLLNPQTFIPNIQLLNSTLQEFFQCFVGANIYLTPAGTQGFAPHYDDIEAFVLQLEGEKHWKLYNPRSPNEALPRESSRNFKEEEIGEPILEVTLQPGDLLYFPRGIIHQAKCLPHVHSLHITVSCYQRNSWADLLEKILPVALQSAINEDVEFRKGLPIGYLNSMGVVYSDHESDQRQEIKDKFYDLFNRILEYCPLDAGFDQLGADYTYDALPPWVTEVEKRYGADRSFKPDILLDALTKRKDQNIGVKLVRATSVRLVSEGEEIFLYYTTDNSLVYHEHESCNVTVTIQWARAIEFLIHSYPKFVQMKDLPVCNNANKPGKWKRITELVYFLWQKGLLLFDLPLGQLCS